MVFMLHAASNRWHLKWHFRTGKCLASMRFEVAIDFDDISSFNLPKRNSIFDRTKTTWSWCDWPLLSLSLSLSLFSLSFYLSLFFYLSLYLYFFLFISIAFLSFFFHCHKIWLPKMVAFNNFSFLFLLPKFNLSNHLAVKFFLCIEHSRMWWRFA